MRNAEAARYSRWAAAAAIFLLLATAGIYARRSWLQYRERKDAPRPVPFTVQQQSAGFSFSKVEKDRTIFTVSASKATEFKDQNRSVLEDVSITMFGSDGSRDDTIQTKECSYDPPSGNIRCQGNVQIEIENALDAKQPGHPHAVRLETSDLRFNQQTGAANTDKPLSFHFAAGEGIGVGITYSPGDAKLRLERDVHITLNVSRNPNEAPAHLDGSSLEFDRDTSMIYLQGPAHVEQDGRNLTCGLVSLHLDDQMHPREIVATDGPRVTSSEPADQIEVSADTIRGALNADGWLENVLLEGNVRGSRKTGAESDDFAAQRTEILMDAGQNQPKHMTASGSVVAQIHAGGNFERVETASLEMEFAPGARPSSRRIANAETLAPAKIDWDTDGDKTHIEARRFNTQFGTNGEIQKLLGHSGVQIDRQLPSQPPQHTTAEELNATFADGGWSTLVLDKNVRFRQADRTAEASNARITRNPDVIELEGAPIISDSMTRTTAAKIEIRQPNSQIQATGGVQTTYLADDANSSRSANSKVPGLSQIDLGSGPAHISADALEGNTATGHLTYSGHARFWQGDAVLDAQVIELWRSENHMQARDHVAAAIPQEPTGNSRSTTPSVWDIRAPLLDFWNDSGRAYLQGGVTGVSDEGTMRSKTLELFLSPPANAGAPAASKTQASSESGRQLQRAVAQGGVVIAQGGRRAMADQGTYTVGDGKFVLSGGRPTLTDDSTDTTTVGRSLTFFVANDTILVDSQSGSRTLTKHRVEK